MSRPQGASAGVRSLRPLPGFPERPGSTPFLLGVSARTAQDPPQGWDRDLPPRPISDELCCSSSRPASPAPAGPHRRFDPSRPRIRRDRPAVRHQRAAWFAITYSRVCQRPASAARDSSSTPTSDDALRLARRRWRRRSHVRRRQAGFRAALPPKVTDRTIPPPSRGLSDEAAFLQPSGALLYGARRPDGRSRHPRHSGSRRASRPRVSGATTMDFNAPALAIGNTRLSNAARRLPAPEPDWQSCLPTLRRRGASSVGNARRRSGSGRSKRRAAKSTRDST